MRNDMTSRVLIFVGLAAMVLGALDPLEGSIIILGGAAVVAFGAWLRASTRLRLIMVSLALIIVGVGVMWGLSVVGGFGGTTGRSNWWWVAIVPYPIGWVMALIVAVRMLLDRIEPPRTA
jgi:hypothetical protein